MKEQLTPQSDTKVPDRNHKTSYAIQRLEYVPYGRTLHVIDIENLIGGPNTDLRTASDSVDFYTELSGYEKGDHVVIGVNPHLALDSAKLWPAAKIVTRAGLDGADYALLHEIRDISWNAERYDRIVIGSGDHAFEPAASAYKAVGVAVGVISRRWAISASLRDAADWLEVF